MEKIIVYTDGGSRNNPGIAGAGVFICDEKGNAIKKIAEPLGIQTNNWAEYEAIILGLQYLKKAFGKEKLKNIAVEVRSDSELAVKQLNGKYQIKEESLFPQFIKVWNMRVADFPTISFTHIPREKNREADALSNVAMDKQESSKKQRNLLEN